MTSEELVQRVSAAIERVRWETGVMALDGDKGAFEEGKTRAARAAISTVLSALEDPTEGMREAGGRQDHLAVYGEEDDDIAWGDVSEDARALARSDASSVWSAMLSQLRKELSNGD